MLKTRWSGALAAFLIVAPSYAKGDCWKELANLRSDVKATEKINKVVQCAAEQGVELARLRSAIDEASAARDGAVSAMNEAKTSLQGVKETSDGIAKARREAVTDINEAGEKAKSEITSLLKTIKSEIATLGTRIDRLEKEVSAIPRVLTGTLTCDQRKQPLGSGWENRQTWTINFSRYFKSPPTISASLSQIEAYSSADANVWGIRIGSITKDSASITLQGAHIDSSLSNCMVSWVAVGR